MNMNSHVSWYTEMCLLCLANTIDLYNHVYPEVCIEIWHVLAWDSSKRVDIWTDWRIYWPARLYFTNICTDIYRNISSERCAFPYDMLGPPHMYCHMDWNQQWTCLQFEEHLCPSHESLNNGWIDDHPMQGGWVHNPWKNLSLAHKIWHVSWHVKLHCILAYWQTC